MKLNEEIRFKKPYRRYTEETSSSETTANVWKSYKTNTHHDVSDWKVGTSQTN